MACLFRAACCGFGAPDALLVPLRVSCVVRRVLGACDATAMCVCVAFCMACATVACIDHAMCYVL